MHELSQSQFEWLSYFSTSLTVSRAGQLPATARRPHEYPHLSFVEKIDVPLHKPGDEKQACCAQQYCVEPDSEPNREVEQLQRLVVQPRPSHDAEVGKEYDDDCGHNEDGVGVYAGTVGVGVHSETSKLALKDVISNSPCHGHRWVLHHSIGFVFWVYGRTVNIDTWFCHC